jgi:hypothetical protein
MNDDLDKVPAKIESELRRLSSRTTVLVPPDVDNAVLARARRRFEEIRRDERWFAWWIPAAAAVVLALAWIGFSLLQATRYERADVDRSGQIDILDAFALARRIQQGSAQGYDVNGDGVVDKGDVDAVAAQAVRLKKGSA